MEAFQKLRISPPENEKNAFFKELKAVIAKSNWVLREDLISNYKKNTFTGDKDILCIESEKFLFDEEMIQGLLWIWDYSGYYEVFNIIPIGKNRFEKKEYNYILNKFNEQIVQGLAKKYDANVQLTKSERLLIDAIGKDAYGALNKFSVAANKSTGHSHPYDFERWCEFLFIVFRNDIEIDTDELIGWFEENGWTNEMATQLVLDFEYSINLLERYEQN